MAHFENDLSKGNVVRQLILFALPFLVSSIVQSLYNVADMLIVGNFSGTASMSGVNIGGQVTFILTNIVVGLCSGGTVLIAQYLGAKRQQDMKDTIATLDEHPACRRRCHHHRHADPEKSGTCLNQDPGGIL